MGAFRSSTIPAAADVAPAASATPPPVSRHAAKRPALHRTPFRTSAPIAQSTASAQPAQRRADRSMDARRRAMGDGGAGCLVRRLRDDHGAPAGRHARGAVDVAPDRVVIDASWLPLARRLAADLGVSPRVTFLRSPRATMPMAWGILRPAVLMPADADGWPIERLRIVLLTSSRT